MSDTNKTTEQVDRPAPNPTGKGGFGDNPQNRNPGGWKKENTISYQYNRFLNMTPDQLKDWSKTPANERTVAMDLAYNRIVASRNSLQDVKEVTDRTEGKAIAKVDLTNSDGTLNPYSKLTDEEIDAELRRILKKTGA